MKYVIKKLHLCDGVDLYYTGSISYHNSNNKKYAYMNWQRYAKRYSTYANAKRALNRLKRICCDDTDLHSAQIEEVEE